MENLIYATFPDKESGTEVYEKMQDLDQLGDITIYAIALIRKDGENQFSLLLHDGGETDGMPATGALVGTAVGALAGPMGMAIGMLTGAMAGSVDKDDYGDVVQQFVDKVKEQLAPGELAIVIDAEEETGTIIDSYLSPYHGTVGRTPIDEVYAANDRAQWTS